MAPTRIAAGIVDLIDGYDGFIVDVWGTLHDGIVVLPGVIECLSQLRAHGKRTVLLSNAPRRSEVEARHLESLGIGEELFDALLTAGESCRQSLVCGSRYLHVGPPGNRGLLDRAKFEEVAEIASADFLLVTGLSG